MKLTSFLALALVLITVPVFSQTDSKKTDKAKESSRQRHSIINVNPLLTLMCPVSIDARHAADGTMMNVKGDQHAHPKGVGQGLKVTLTHNGAPQINEAKITVHGFAAHGRMMGALTQHEKTDAARTLLVKFTQEKNNTSTAYIWVPGMSAIESIDLESATYADGSTREFGQKDFCHAPANSMMLIAGH